MKQFRNQRRVTEHAKISNDEWQNLNVRFCSASKHASKVFSTMVQKIFHMLMTLIFKFSKQNFLLLLIFCKISSAILHRKLGRILRVQKLRPMVTLVADSQKMYLDIRIILQIWVLQGYPDKLFFWTCPPRCPPTPGGPSHGYVP